MYHATTYLQESVAWMQNMHGIHIDLNVSQEYSGLRHDDEIHMALETVKVFQEHNISIECILIDARWAQTHPLDARFAECYTIVEASHIQSLLQTSDDGFIAIKIRDVALANSALICESLVTCMRLSYPERFAVYEHTMIREIHESHETMHVMTIEGHIITTKDVVVCTNGFQQLPIINADTAQQDLTPAVRGVIGYINGYHIAHDIPAHAYSYTDQTLETSSFDTPPYRYLTTRPHPEQGTLICVGGEETHIDEMLTYNPQIECPARVVEQTNTFLKNTFAPTK